MKDFRYGVHPDTLRKRYNISENVGTNPNNVQGTAQVLTVHTHMRKHTCLHKHTLYIHNTHTHIQAPTIHTIKYKHILTVHTCAHTMRIYIYFPRN